MGLSICYECPQCHQSYDQELSELGPGKRPRCSACETTTELPPHRLKQFESALEEYCRT